MSDLTPQDKHEFEAPPCNIGELVDIRTHRPKNYNREFIIEIRRLRGSGKYFPRTQCPDGIWYVTNYARETKQKAFNTGKKLLDFFDEDVRGFEDQDMPE